MNIFIFCFLIIIKGEKNENLIDSPIQSINNIQINYPENNQVESASPIIITNESPVLKQIATTIPEDKVINMFELTQFECNKEEELAATKSRLGGPVDICKKIQVTYESATKRLSSILDLKAVIKYKVVWRDFCKNSVGTDCANVGLGQSAPSSYWSIQSFNIPELDKSYLYPQSLLKQYKPDYQFNGPDIIIEHDSRLRNEVWFVDDNFSIGELYEFEYLVLHELLHGLGFMSSLEPYLESNKEVLTPPIKRDSNTKNYLGLSNPFIYDKFLAFGSSEEARLDRWILHLVNYTKDWNHPTLKEWEDHFANATIFKRSQKLFKLATIPKSLFFLFNKPIPTYNETQEEHHVHRRSENSEDPVIPQMEKFDNIDFSKLDRNLEELEESKYQMLLHTPPRFSPGSSLSHVDQYLYKTTPDFIMRPATRIGKVLDNPELKGVVLGSFGPGLLHMLSHLGYKLKEKFDDYQNNFTTFSNYSKHQEGGAGSPLNYSVITAIAILLTNLFVALS